MYTARCRAPRTTAPAGWLMPDGSGMRSRRELGFVLAAVLVLLILVARTGSMRNREPSADPRRSTYLPTPAGAHGFAAALERLGVSVVRLRQRLPRL